MALMSTLKTTENAQVIRNSIIVFIGIFQICILKILSLPSERLCLILKLTQDSDFQLFS